MAAPPARSLSDLENRSENSKNQGQIYMDLRRIAELFSVCPEMALSESRKLAYRPDLGVMLKK